MHQILTLLVILLVFLFFFYKNKIKINQNQISKERKLELNDINLARKLEIEKDKTRVTKKQIRSKLIELNLSPFVIELFDETRSLKEFGFYDTFIPPDFIIDQTKKEQDLFEIDRYIPLFETMDDFLEVLAYDTKLNSFIRYCPEDNFPIENNEILNWDGIFVMQILTWYEDLKTDKEILNICNLLGLKYGTEILESIKNELGTKYTSAEITNWETKITTNKMYKT